MRVSVCVLMFLGLLGVLRYGGASGLLELSLGKFRNVLLNQTNSVEAVIRNIANNVTVVIFQVHAQQSDVMISFNKIPSVNSSAIGVDKGLVSILRPLQSVCTWHLWSLDANQVLSTTISVPYMEKDPIPGGCNLEFDLEVDPNIYLDYTLIDTHIKFAPANLGYTRCVKNFTALSKTFFVLYLIKIIKQDSAGKAEHPAVGRYLAGCNKLRTK